MTRYDDAKRQLKSAPRNWAISGAAGFIGSNLLETLLKLDQRVTGLDNFVDRPRAQSRRGEATR